MLYSKINSGSMVVNVKPKIIKPLKENIWGKLYDLEPGKDFGYKKKKYAL